MKIAIYGYGNLGRGVELAAGQNPDAELVGIFTRRDPESISTAVDGTAVYSVDRLNEFKDEIDVLIICGGSATDLPRMTPELARDFNVVDSFDTHARIPEHFERVDIAAREGGNLALFIAGQTDHQKQQRDHHILGDPLQTTLEIKAQGCKTDDDYGDHIGHVDTGIGDHGEKAQLGGIAS